MGDASLHHLALGARDPETVARFYRDVLGMREVARHHTDGGTLRSVWLSLGARGVLMVERIEGTLASESVTLRPGLFLLAVEVAADERSAWEHRLEAAGHPIEAGTDHTSYTRDPEGNRVALSSYPLPEGH